ncbi:MAG: hypothetical protein RBS36_07810 [Thiomicrospira sp.]|jgi:hypothetical protein|nr:hypothetical protein [Thiomicrospira sp.]
MNMNNIDETMRSEYDPVLFDNAEVGKYAMQFREASNVDASPPEVQNSEAESDALS